MTIKKRSGVNEKFPGSIVLTSPWIPSSGIIYKSSICPSPSFPSFSLKFGRFCFTRVFDFKIVDLFRLPFCLPYFNYFLFLTWYLIEVYFNKKYLLKLFRGFHSYGFFYLISFRKFKKLILFSNT